MLERNKDGKINYKKIIIESGLYLVLFCMLVAIIL
ncbi:MAG: beta-methylgalactoside transporter, partial [Fusobacteriales bacterium]